jgi:hypothetical protein
MTESLFVYNRLSDEQLIIEVRQLAGCEAQSSYRLAGVDRQRRTHGRVQVRRQLD